MNLKSTICCALLFLKMVDATNRHLRGRGRGAGHSWSVFTFPKDLDFGIKTSPESFAPGEPDPGRPSSCALGNRGIVACKPINAPVLCGEKNCQYDNLCSAQAGPGFTKEDCKPAFNLAVDEGCAKPKLTGGGCIEIYSPVSCGDCMYDNICFAKAAGCEPATNVQGQVIGMPVPGYTLPGSPAVDDTVVVLNMPVPGYTLPGNSPVVDTVVIYDTPVVPDDTLPVDPSEPIEEPGTDSTGMGPSYTSTIAIGEPNPATPIPNDTLSVKPNEPIEEPATGMDPSYTSTIAIGEPNPATPILVDEMTIPGKLPDSLYSDTEDSIYADPDPGRSISGKPPVSVTSGSTEEATSVYPYTPVMIRPESPPVSVLVVAEETSSGSSNPLYCREPRSNANCEDEVFDPVVCGKANCMYGNLCLGIGAGFLETDCGSAP
jgi:hypothetical protein